MKIDFSDISDIEGSASLILSMSNAATGTPSLIPGAFASTSPAKAAREWVNGVKEHIGEMSAGDAMRATSCLDLMHRLAYGKPVDSTLLDTYRLTAFDSFVRGDSSVDRYMLFNVVSDEVRQRNRKFFGKPLQWESVCLDRWHKQFRHGASLENLSDHDTIRRVTALLGSDLWAFETRNESRFKQTLFENHRHYLDSMLAPMHNAKCKMHNVKSIHNAQCTMHNDESNCSLLITNYSLDKDYELTKALQSFLLSSASYLSPEEFTTYDTQIRNALIVSKETNRYHREALRLRAL